MGGLLIFLILVAAALFGVWKFVPGGQDMLRGAADFAMSHSPLKKDEAAVVVEEEPAIVVDTVVDEVVDTAESAADEVEAAADDAAAELEDAPE